MYAGAAVLDGVHDVQHAHEGRLHLDKAAGRYRRGPYARRRVTGTVTAAGAAAFDEDGPQHPKAVAVGVQVAHPVDPGMLEAWHLGDRSPAFATRIWISVSISNPSPHNLPSPGGSRSGDVEAQYRSGSARRRCIRSRGPSTAPRSTG